MVAGWDESVKHNQFPSGTKEGKSRGWKGRRSRRMPEAAATEEQLGVERFSFHPVSRQLGEMSRETGGECRSC